MAKKPFGKNKKRLIKKQLPNNSVSNDKEKNNGLVETKQAHFSGPLPPPSIFNGYADIIPDAPERILTIFEQDSAHARDFPRLALEAQKDDNRRAHWMAWSLVAGAFVMSLVLAAMDKDILAGTVIGTTLVAIVTGFLKSRNHD